MMENYQTPRGTQDLLPEATRKWQKVEDLIRNLCDVYGYEEIRTPVFEDTRVFKRETTAPTWSIRKCIRSLCMARIR